MAINYMGQASIFDSKCQALVNPVNCVGVSGKGLAKQFAKKFPIPTGYYKRECDNGNMKIGTVITEWSGQSADPTSIIYFPTKGHWRNPSKYSYIGLGIISLTGVIISEHIKSIAIPALGCGEGGLEWPIVRRYIQQMHKALFTIGYLIRIDLHDPV